MGCNKKDRNIRMKTSMCSWSEYNSITCFKNSVLTETVHKNESAIKKNRLLKNKNIHWIKGWQCYSLSYFSIRAWFLLRMLITKYTNNGLQQWQHSTCVMCTLNKRKSTCLIHYSSKWIIPDFLNQLYLKSQLGP